MYAFFNCRKCSLSLSLTVFIFVCVCVCVCAQVKSRLRLSAATLIVVPPHLLAHWKNQIQLYLNPQFVDGTRFYNMFSQ
jgi:hypothetical protein